MLYFAYGSNLNLDQMKYRCPDHKVIGAGVLKGWQLNFRGPLDIERRKKSSVVGGLFLISVNDLIALDRYEGYPRFYDRVNVNVQCKDPVHGDIVHYDVITYTMTRQNKGEPAPCGQHYFYSVMAGYKDFSLDQKYLLDAVKRAGF